MTILFLSLFHIAWVLLYLMFYCSINNSSNVISLLMVRGLQRERLWKAGGVMVPVAKRIDQLAPGAMT